MLDVETGLAATGEHQCGVHEHLAAVVDWQTFSTHWDGRRERRAQSHPVGKTPNGMESDVSRHLVATRFHDRRARAVSVHVVGALSSGGLSGFATVRIPG